MSQNKEQLTIEMFTSAIGDSEFNQYKFLAALQKYSESFRKYKLYPALADLIALVSKLRKLINKESELKTEFPEEIIGFDLKKKKPIYEKIDCPGGLIKGVFDLINWSLPEINKVIEEGKVIYDFIEENIAIELIGILPMYKEEGYFIIPGHQAGKIEVYGYVSSIYSSEEEKYRILKTNFIYSILNKQIVNKTPQTIKLDLIERFPKLPTPVVYGFYTDLDFPFAESIFPVVKRKLLKTLAV